MLEVTTTDDTSATTEAEYTEQQVIELAKAIPRRSLRAMEKITGWSKSRLSRFLSQLDAENSGTAAGQGDCPTPHQFRDLLINGAKEFDNKIPPETAEAAVDRILAEGKVKAPRPDDKDDLAGDQFDWCKDAADVLLDEQRAIAAYINTQGGLVIREMAGPLEEADAVVVIEKGNIHAFVDKLTDLLGYGRAP
jgi:hypothetical protein